jgi:hypothetical protein
MKLRPIFLQKGWKKRFSEEEISGLKCHTEACCIFVFRKFAKSSPAETKKGVT